MNNNIDPLVLKFFREKVAEKTASLGAAAAGAGVLGGGLLLAGMGGNIWRDHRFGRAERLEEKARRMKALQRARSLPRYNEGGGMHG